MKIHLSVGNACLLRGCLVSKSIQNIALLHEFLELLTSKNLDREKVIFSNPRHCTNYNLHTLIKKQAV